VPTVDSTTAVGIYGVVANGEVTVIAVDSPTAVSTVATNDTVADSQRGNIITVYPTAMVTVYVVADDASADGG